MKNYQILSTKVRLCLCQISAVKTLNCVSSHFDEHWISLNTRNLKDMVKVFSRLDEDISSATFFCVFLIISHFNFIYIYFDIWLRGRNKLVYDQLQSVIKICFFLYSVYACYFRHHQLQLWWSFHFTYFNRYWLLIYSFLVSKMERKLCFTRIYSLYFV